LSALPSISFLTYTDSIDVLDPNTSREEWDVGVKFAAWGQTSDRFYTGSSDGVVKAWNVRAPRGEEHVRDVLTLSGGVAAGSWSPDFSNLIIGDSTGKIHLLSVENSDSDSDSPKISKPITPHASLPLPTEDINMDLAVEETAQEISRQFLDRNQIILHPDPYIGAIQGPAYSSTGLFCTPTQKHNNKFSQLRNKELQSQKQRYEISKTFFPRLDTHMLQSSDPKLHLLNCAKDLHYENLSPSLQDEMRAEGVDFGFESDPVFEYGDIIDGEADSLTEGANIQTREEIKQLEAFIKERLQLLRGLRGLFQSLDV